MTVRDGPALRALALIPYAQYLLDRGFALDKAYVREHLYNPKRVRAPGSVIKNDLEEVANGWWAEGYDLWEELCVSSLLKHASLALKPYPDRDIISGRDWCLSARCKLARSSLRGWAILSRRSIMRKRRNGWKRH